MFKPTLLLEVPTDRILRHNIRQEVDDYFVKNKIIPPVSYNKLADLADDLLEIHQWNRSLKAFVMVCCGNAIWRTVVGTIPYKRRMLLLPQCLKNSNMCKGQQDELGLLCSECGNCNISGFLQEAENLGYLTIVTEGTTIASRLVESGKVDAIIGVGCMEVLQKMFLAVRKYSVPAIGVPLLSCGCIDTTADEDWIKEEINHIEQHQDFQLFNLNELNDRTALLFTPAQIDQLLNLSGSATDSIVRDILLAGGKRIRPLLTALTYESLNTHPDKNVLNHLSLSVECFHKASLIHDDIEDNDSLRYGKETLHTRYGIPIAINVGDLLIGEGYRLISESGLDAKLIKNCLKVASKGHKALSIGQGAELMARMNGETLPLKEIINIYENKTAAAFRVSLLLGAAAADADPSTIELLEHFSTLIGIAYQLKDDLEDFNSEENFSSFENPSVLTAVLFEKAGEEEISKIREAVSQKDMASLTFFLEKHSVRELITSIVKDHLDDIDSCLGNLQNIPLKLALHEIVGKTFRNYL